MRSESSGSPYWRVLSGFALLPPWFFFLSLASAVALADKPAEKIFELAISRATAAAKPRVLRVEKDDLVRLRVTSEVPGEIHFHAYRLEAKVTPGIPTELGFEARATGRFRIEWHPTGGAATKGNHHGPPLATLEVRPK